MITRVQNPDRMDTRRLDPVNKETDITRDKIKISLRGRNINLFQKKKEEKQEEKQQKTGTKIIFANGSIDSSAVSIDMMYKQCKKSGTGGGGGGFARRESVWSGASSARLKFEGVAQSVFSTEFSSRRVVCRSPKPGETFTDQYTHERDNVSLLSVLENEVFGE